MSVEQAPSLETLREIHLFQVFSDQELQQLLSVLEPKEYEAYSNIVIEGELSWGLYLIARGTVGILKSSQTTKNTYDIAQLESGSFFGEISLIEEHPRSATVRALTDCNLFFISKAEFQSFLDQSPERKLRFYEGCVHSLVSRLRELNDSYIISQYHLWKTILDPKERKVA